MIYYSIKQNKGSDPSAALCNSSDIVVAKNLKQGFQLG